MAIRLSLLASALLLTTGAHAGSWGFRTTGTPTTTITGAPQPTTKTAVDKTADLGSDADDNAMSATPPDQDYDDHRTFNQYLKGTDADYTMTVDASQSTNGSDVTGKSTLSFVMIWSPSQEGETPPTTVQLQINRAVSLNATGSGHALVQDATGNTLTEIHGTDPANIVALRASGVEMLIPLTLSAPVTTNSDGTVTALFNVDSDQLIASSSGGDAAWVRETIDATPLDAASSNTAVKWATPPKTAITLKATSDHDKVLLRPKSINHSGGAALTMVMVALGCLACAIGGKKTRVATVALAALLFPVSASADNIIVQCLGVKNGNAGVTTTGNVNFVNNTVDYLYYQNGSKNAYGELLLNATS